MKLFDQFIDWVIESDGRIRATSVAIGTLSSWVLWALVWYFLL